MSAAHVLIVSILCAVFLAAPVSAQNNQPQGAQQGGDHQGGSSSGTPGDAIYLDPTPFIQEVDTNKDGNVSKEEWLAAELPDDLYSRFDIENKGYITREVMAAKYHPPLMDPEKSGRFTLAMLRAHISKQLAGGNSGQQSGGQSK